MLFKLDKNNNRPINTGKKKIAYDVRNDINIFTMLTDKTTFKFKFITPFYYSVKISFYKINQTLNHLFNEFKIDAEKNRHIFVGCLCMYSFACACVRSCKSHPKIHSSSIEIFMGPHNKQLFNVHTR